MKILDFGLARLVTSEMTRTGLVVGTVSYMAPEQLRGEKPDHRADIFSFGVLLYQLIGGQRPFQGDSAASTMYKILQRRPRRGALDPALPPGLTAIVDRAIAKAREDRYQRMTDLLRDLEAIYEQVRGADRRVISRVTAALQSSSSSDRPRVTWTAWRTTAHDSQHACLAHVSPISHTAARNAGRFDTEPAARHRPLRSTDARRARSATSTTPRWAWPGALVVVLGATGWLTRVVSLLHPGLLRGRPLTPSARPRRPDRHQHRLTTDSAS